MVLIGFLLPQAANQVIVPHQHPPEALQVALQAADRIVRLMACIQVVIAKVLLPVVHVLKNIPVAKALILMSGIIRTKGKFVATANIGREANVSDTDNRII